MAEEATPTPEEGVKTETITPTETTTYTQEVMDDIAGKVRRTEEAKRAKLETQIADLETKLLSEDEKKIKEARDEGAAEVLKDLAKLKRESAIREDLLARGISRDQLGGIARLVDPEVEDVTEAVEAVAKAYAALFDTKQVGGGGGRNPEPGEATDYSPAGMDRILAPMNHQEQVAWYKEHGAEVEAWQAAQSGMVTTRAPGQGLGYNPIVETSNRKR